MLNFHLMGNRDFTIKQLKEQSAILEYNKYTSILLTYDSLREDNLLKTIAALDLNQKVQYMIAIRTYAISPEYMAMILNTLNQEFKNKIVFNIVSGEVKPYENIYDGNILPEMLIDTSEKRIKITGEWLEKLLSLKSLKQRPFLLMSGKSPMTKELANRYADAFLGTSLDYIRENEHERNQIKTKRRFCVTGIVIRDTDDEASFVVNSIIEKRGNITPTIYGSKETVIKELKRLEKKYGVTDILIHTWHSFKEDDEIYRIDSLVKELACGTDGLMVQ
jgi:alkanesulfonate monooxygenase SsuD/methylene tetrahydromethanopterin reductase-like flavin-dependent oxidoreductase (luciferase family)